MRKQKTVKIETKQFTILELTVNDIIDLSSSQGIGNSVTMVIENNDVPLAQMFLKFAEEIEIIMGKCCDFSLEDLKKLAPSEIKLLFDAFKEVNSDFLLLLREVGILPALVQIKDQMAINFSKSLVD